jgi:hypothetical protein
LRLYRAVFILVIVLPFLGQAFPTPGAIPLFVPVALLFLPATLLLRIADRGVPGLLLGDPRFMAITALIVLTYIYGFIISIDLQYEFVFREVVNGVVAMLVVFAIANSDWTAEDCKAMVQALAWALLSVGLFVSVLGAYKFWLFLMAGEQLDFVVAASGAEYPWGTSLVTDSNFYSLTTLVAILSALYLANYVRPLSQAVLVMLVGVLFAVGVAAGSRRFWVAAPLIVGAQLLWMVWRSGVRQNSIVLTGLILLLGGVPATIYLVAPDFFDVVFTQAWDLQYRFRTLFASDLGYEYGSRTDVMEFGIRRLDGFVAWFGGGFDYLNRFSCEFTVCGGAGYPHMPLISAFLYGGVIAAVAALAMYVYITVASIRLLPHAYDFGWLFFPMLVALLFGAISGNGPLSIRSYIILGAVCVGLLRAIQVESTGVRNVSATGVE